MPRHLCTALLLSVGVLLLLLLSTMPCPSLFSSSSVTQKPGPGRGRSPTTTTTQFTPRVRVFDLTSTTLPQSAHAAEKSCEGDGRESEETRRHAQSDEVGVDADLLTATPTPDSSLTHTDIMGPLIWSRFPPFSSMTAVTPVPAGLLIEGSITVYIIILILVNIT